MTKGSDDSIPFSVKPRYTMLYTDCQEQWIEGLEEF